MKIKKQDLLEALEIVKPGLANVEMIEQTSSFAFFDDRVVTYNDSISISHPVKGLQVRGAIRSQELYGFLTKAKKEEIQIIITDSRFKLKCGSAVVSLTLQSEIVLPLEEIENTIIEEDVTEEFLDSLDFVKDSCSRDMSRRVLTCIYVKKNEMQASDGFQIMRALMEDEFAYDNILIPHEHVPEIKKINPTQVGVSDGWIHWKNPEGTILSCRTLAERYPKIDSHFDVEGPELTFPKKMNEMLERVMVFTKKDHAADEEMQIKVEGTKLTVYGANEYGEIKEPAKIEYDGEPISFWIAPYLLKNILSKNGRCTVGKEKIKFQQNDWEYIAVLRN